MGKISEPLYRSLSDGEVLFQNVESGLCLAVGREQGLDRVQQETCDVKSDAQRFACQENQITAVKDSALCVTASGMCSRKFTVKVPH